MNKSYTEYIKNLKIRRHDEMINQTDVSDDFYDETIPPAVRYALESMQEIDPSYNYKLFSSFRRTQDLITEKLRTLDLAINVRYQGPHNTDTHVELFNELELLVILSDTNEKPSEAVASLGETIVGVLSEAQAYNKVDYSSRNKVQIETRQPVAQVSITPAIWINSSLYNKSPMEINRGICEYNFSKRTRKIYLPFLNMARINSRDRKLSGSLKSMIRIIRSLIHDSPNEIDLTFDEVIGIIFNIPIKEMAVPSNHYLSLLPNVSLQIKRLINDDSYREKLLSPAKSEYIFGKKSKIPALKALKLELDELITDINDALSEKNQTLMSSIDYNKKVVVPNRAPL
ncbi:MAG: hypothetical protein ACI8QD_000331 [Cyclobacteriaceae bacterium]|jgi:hypothetical protein